MMGGPAKKSARYSKFLNVRRGSGKKEGAIGVTVKGKGRPGRQGGKPKRIKVGGQRPASPAAIAQRKEEEENSFPYRPSLQEFYGPTVNLRAFRPGHLEFGGRKTGGRGKKMMMPGHYKFAFTPDHYGGRSKPWNTGPNVGDIPEMTRTRKAAELRNSRGRRQAEARMKSSLGRHRRDRPHLRGRLSRIGEEAVQHEYQPAVRLDLRHPEFKHPSDQGGPMDARRGLGASERHRAVMKEGRRILSHPAQRVRTSREVQPRVSQMGLVPEGFVPKVARARYSEFASQRGGPTSIRED